MATPSDELTAHLNRRRRRTGDGMLEASQDDKIRAMPAPAAPSYPELVSARAKSISLKWTAPSDEPAADTEPPAPHAPHPFVYRVEFGYPWLGGWTSCAERVAKPAFVATELEPNTNYVFRVTARRRVSDDILLGRPGASIAARVPAASGASAPAPPGEDAEKTESALPAWGTPSASSYTLATLTEEADAALAEPEGAKVKASEEEFLARKKAEDEARRAEAERKAAFAAREADALRAQLRKLEADKAAEATALRESSARDIAAMQSQLQASNLQVEKLRQEGEEQLRKAAADRAAELKAEKEAAESKGAAMTAESDALKKQLADLAELKLAQEAEVAELQRRSETRSEADTARLRALQRTREEDVKSLEAKLAEVDRERRRALQKAEQAAREEVERERAEAARMEKAAADAQAARDKAAEEMRQLTRKLADLQAEKEAMARDAEEKIKAQRARAEDVESLMQWQAAESERIEREKAKEIAALRARGLEMQAELTAAKVRAATADASAAALSQHIVKQAEETAELRRLARMERWRVESLQGAGPNPKLENKVVGLGHARENVRFFLEVCGWDKEKPLVKALERLKELKAKGYPDDGIREALTVCKRDDDHEEYLKEFMTRHGKAAGAGSKSATGAGAGTAAAAEEAPKSDPKPQSVGK